MNIGPRASSLLLSFFILSVFHFAYFPHGAIAREQGTSAATVEQANYVLPYPGILPDSPLYFMKMARDRVVYVLISDPIKKAEFNLLQADKRLQAGLYLFDKDPNEARLALSTITKGENYFEDALRNVKDGHVQGLEVGETARTLSHASKKHLSVLSQMEKRVPNEERKTLLLLLQRVQRLSLTADTLTQL